MANRCIGPAGPQAVDGVGQRVVDPPGVDQLAQQRVHQAGQDVVIGHGVVSTLLGEPEQLARTEEEGRRVLTARRDDVVRGILEPGAQPAGQTRVEARSPVRIAAQQRQDLSARPTIRRRVTLMGRPEQWAWCDEDHRGSVPTGCDTALP